MKEEYEMENSLRCNAIHDFILLSLHFTELYTFFT